MGVTTEVAQHCYYYTVQQYYNLDSIIFWSDQICFFSFDQHNKLD